MEWFWEQPKAAFRCCALWWFGKVSRTLVKSISPEGQFESDWSGEESSPKMSLRLKLAWWMMNLPCLKMEELQMQLMERAMGDRPPGDAKRLESKVVSNLANFLLRGGFKDLFIFYFWGKWSNLTWAYFSKGLKTPTGLSNPSPDLPWPSRQAGAFARGLRFFQKAMDLATSFNFQLWNRSTFKIF